MSDNEEMSLAPVDLVSQALPVAALIEQARYVDALFRGVLKSGTDYGVVPGMPRDAKPALFQAGAQMLCRGLQLCPKYTVMSVQRSAQIVAYVITCELTHYSSNRVVGTGLGACNTQEKKYAKTLRTLAERAAQYNDPAPTAMELENTVLKMAKKRALVDAVLNATAASRVFTTTSADEDDEPTPQAPATQAQAAAPQAQAGDRRRGRPTTRMATGPAAPAPEPAADREPGMEEDPSEPSAAEIAKAFGNEVPQ